MFCQNSFVVSCMYTKTARHRSQLFKETTWVAKPLRHWSTCKCNDMETCSTWHGFFFLFCFVFLLVRPVDQRKRQLEVIFYLKLVFAILCQIFIFFTKLIALQKLWKVFFISSKTVFSSSRCSNFCSFFPSFPHFPDSKWHM